MTLREVLNEGEQRLIRAGVPEARVNAWHLFSHCFHMERARFFLREQEEADAGAVRAYHVALTKRESRVPLEYITHETEFMGLPFYVDERVLIPRQDTECLVEEVLRVSTGKDILDLCTGSGCIGISLAVLGDCHAVTLADLSADALAVAEKNAGQNGVEVTLCQSDLFAAIDRRFDVIVSNPPYIPAGEISGLMPEVRDHEPVLALAAGEDGLLFYRSIITKSREFLKKGGSLFFEIGCDQGEAVAELMRLHGYKAVMVGKDLAGLDRVVHGVC